MGYKAILARNATSNLAGYSVNIIIGFLLSPFVVLSLGDTIFGIWTLVRSLTGYYGILDFGLFGAVSHYVTRYITKGDEKGVNNTISTAMVILGGVGIFSILLTIILTLNSPQWFSTQTSHHSQFQWALLITGISISINFPLVLYKSVLYSLQRLEVINGIVIVKRILEAVLTVIILNAGYGILGITIVHVTTNIIGWTAQIYLAHSLYPKLSLSVQKFSKDSYKELFGFSLWSTIINTAERTVVIIDSLLIGMFLTVEAVTFYVIGANLVPYYYALIQAITWVITPFATARNALGDQETIKRVFALGTQGTVTLGALIGTGMILLGEDFLKLWMGEKYISGEIYSSSATILTLLTLAVFFRIIQSCGFQVLFGMGKVKYLAFLATLEIILNITLSIALIPQFGLIGVALGTLLPAFLVRGILQSLYLIKVTEIGISDYLKILLVSTLPIFISMYMANWVLLSIQPITSWWDLILRGIGITIPTVLVGYAFCLPKSAKEEGWTFLSQKLNFSKSP